MKVGSKQSNNDAVAEETGTLTGEELAQAPSPQLVEKKKYQIKPRWKPGQSGNPSGRKKTPPDIKAAFRDALPKAVATLIALLDSKKPEIRLRASTTLVERVLGRPDQPLVGADGGPIQVASLVLMPTKLNDG